MTIDLTIKESTSDMKKYLALRRYPYGVKSISYYRQQEEYENITEDDYNNLLQDLKQYIEDLGDLSYTSLSKKYSKAIEEDDKTRFFNQPDFEANFDISSIMNHWTLYEAIIYLLGKDPNKLPYEFMEALLNNSEEHSPFVKKYSVIKELAIRRFGLGRITQGESTCLSYSHVVPHSFLTWAKSSGIHIPPKLFELVEASKGPIIDNKTYSKLKNDFELHKQQTESSIKTLEQLRDDLLSQIQELKQQVWKLEPGPTYSKKLDIANQAHRAISKNLVNGKTVKQQAIEWIQSHYKEDLSNEATEEIAKIVNWDQTGQKTQF